MDYDIINKFINIDKQNETINSQLAQTGWNRYKHNR